MPVELNTPITEGGVQNIYFFNGRILTAEDLQDEQYANLLHNWQFGRSIGEGVLSGLEVTLESSGSTSEFPVLSIAKGIALNRNGQVMELPIPISLKIGRDIEISPGSDSTFTPCQMVEPSMTPTGTGAYILVISPASAYKGDAPRHRLQDDGKVTGCDHRYSVDGVQFKLIYMDLSNENIVRGAIGSNIQMELANTGTTSRSKLRNLLAHLCLGTQDAQSFTTDLFNISGTTALTSQYGPLDTLRTSGCLKSSDVPLALLLWSIEGLEFIDMWSVRRRVHIQADYPRQPFPVFPNDPRTAQLEATYLQFQEHIKLLFKPFLEQGAEVSIDAKDYFYYLPSAGMIPLLPGEYENESSGSVFFSSMEFSPPIFMEGRLLRNLIQLSFSYEPIELQKNEFIRLYYVRENMQSLNNNPGKGVKPYLVFSAGYLPFMGNPLYDLSRFDYSNYGDGGNIII